MNGTKEQLAIFILVVGVILYVVGIAWAGVVTLGYQPEGDDPPPPQLPGFIEQAVIVIGGALATHFGSWLGIEFERQAKGRRRFFAMSNLLSVEGFSRLAAWLYAGSLLLAIVFWLLYGLKPYAATILRDLSYTFFGVVVGVITVFLKAE
ncbi:MAG: hypothetical protein ACP5GX_00310 [Anaerolineae bacterium]